MEPNTFNQQLLKLSKELRGDQLKEIKHLCEFIGKRKLEKVTEGYDLFELLMEQSRLSADNTDFLCEVLKFAGRQDLSDELTNFITRHGGAAAGHNEPSDAERVKINLAAEVIAANLGKTWRKVARKLGLSPVKVQSIAQKQLDLEEMTMEMIREWRKAQGSEACVKQLLVALRECEQNLTAEKVEEVVAKEH